MTEKKEIVLSRDNLEVLKLFDDGESDASLEWFDGDQKSTGRVFVIPQLALERLCDHVNELRAERIRIANKSGLTPAELKMSKLEAVKAVRTRLNLGLREAVAFVEQYRK